MATAEFQFKINVAIYSTTLLIVATILVFIHLGFHYYDNYIGESEWIARQLFDLDEENNLPTWFSSFLLLNNAFFLFIAAASGGMKGANAITKSRKNQIYYLCLAIGFLILAIDEVAGIHESFNTAIDINWAIPGGILVIVVGLAYIPFLLSLDKKLAAWYILSGLIFVSGAIGVELLSEDMDEAKMAYGYATAAEEGMEMFGAWLFLRTNLRWLSST